MQKLWKGLAMAMVLALALGPVDGVAQEKAQIKPGGIKQKELVDFLKALRSRTFTKAGLAVATTTTKVKTANTLQFMIDGVHYSKAAEDNVTVSSMTNTAAGQTCRIRVEVNSSGTLSFVQGQIITGASGTGLAPARSAAKATVGYIDIPASYVFGTSNFNDTSVTLTDGDSDLDTNALES